MKAVNRTWLDEAGHMSVVYINTDGFNFAEKADAKKGLAGQVLKKLHELGWGWENDFSKILKQKDWFSLTSV